MPRESTRRDQALNRVLGQVIFEERQRAGITQAALAERAGVHAMYISQLERGMKSPTVRVLVDLARALGTRPSLLMERVEEESVEENRK